jgi:hypothetical protein
MSTGLQNIMRNNAVSPEELFLGIFAAVLLTSLWVALGLILQWI